MERTAHCHCGQLTATVTGEPMQVYLCHCKACQRRTGSIAHWGTRWRKDQVTLAGPVKVYARRADSGFEIRCHFCSNCGTTVMAEGDRLPELCVIAAGCFAGEDIPAPTGSIWEESMHPWLVVPTISEHHAQDFPAAPPT